METGVTELPSNWSELSRSRGKAIEKRKPGKNIFAGKSKLEEATVGGVNVVRLSVIARGATAVPHSFAVESNTQWQPSEAVLPLDLKWQQSLGARWDLQ